MYFTSGSDRAFEQLMQTRPGADHFDSGEAGAPEGLRHLPFLPPALDSTSFVCMRNVPTSRASSPPLTAR